MNSNTIAIIWLVLVAVFLVTMFIVSRGWEKSPEANTEKPGDPKPASTEAAQPPAGSTEKHP